MSESERESEREIAREKETVWERKSSFQSFWASRLILVVWL